MHVVLIILINCEEQKINNKMTKQANTVFYGTLVMQIYIYCKHVFNGFYKLPTFILDLAGVFKILYEHL